MKHKVGRALAVPRAGAGNFFVVLLCVAVGVGSRKRPGKVSPATTWGEKSPENNKERYEM